MTQDIFESKTHQEKSKSSIPIVQRKTPISKWFWIQILRYSYNSCNLNINYKKINKNCFKFQTSPIAIKVFSLFKMYITAPLFLFLELKLAQVKYHFEANIFLLKFCFASKKCVKILAWLKIACFELKLLQEKNWPKGSLASNSNWTVALNPKFLKKTLQHSSKKTLKLSSNLKFPRQRLLFN